ncbi:MAG: hypothetical protein ACRD2M_10995 [Terriglobales bacterium]
MSHSSQPVPAKLLSNLVQKMVLHNARYSGVACRVLPPAMHGQPYVIQVSMGRVMRQVLVDTPAIHRMEVSGRTEPAVVRDLQNSIQNVMRLSQRGQ